MDKRITIGVHINQEHKDFSQIRSICKTAEELSFDSVTLMDHFRPYHPPKNGNLLECWITLSALAMETKRVKIGSSMTCASYRNPALLAKIAACLDHISGGRLRFGIGAGWFREEFEEYGIPFGKPKERIGRLEEAIQIIKKMWVGEEVSFSGRYYKIERAVCHPKPMQKPHPPIIVGGRGEKYTLRLVAKHADAWNSPPISLKQYAHKLEVLKRHCLEVGRDFEEIKLSWSARAILSSDRRRIAELCPHARNLDDYIDAHLIGTPEQCAKKMQSFIQLGVTDFELVFPDTMQSFAELVLPKFKN